MIARLKRKIRALLLTNPSKANYKFVLKAHSGLFDRGLSSRILETKCFTDILQPIVMDCPPAKRVLVIAPHLDDDIFGAGGVLLKLAERLTEITIVYATGADEFDGTREKVQAEAIAISAELGSTPIFLQGTAGAIAGDEELGGQLTEILKNTKPDLVFAPFLLDNNADHQNINQLLAQSLRATGLLPEIWSYQIYSTVIPNVVVNITKEMDEKERLMRMWKSVPGNRDWAHYVRGMNAMNCRFIPGKEQIYGEAFFVVPAMEYLDLCERYFRSRE
jgi:LmbE family N-acetylglucosaminyl deacetylase